MNQSRMFGFGVKVAVLLAIFFAATMPVMATDYNIGAGQLETFRGTHGTLANGDKLIFTVNNFTDNTLGTYFNVTDNAIITLSGTGTIGATGTTTRFIYTSNAFSLAVANSSSITFSNFGTTTNGQSGGVIYHNGTGTLNLGTSNSGTLIFNDNKARYNGGAIDAYHITITGGTTTFTNNSAASNGGAISANNSITLHATDGNFEFKGNTDGTSTTAKANAIHVSGNITLAAANGKQIELFDPITTGSGMAGFTDQLLRIIPGAASRTVVIGSSTSDTGTVIFDGSHWRDNESKNPTNHRDYFESKLYGNGTLQYGNLAIQNGAIFSMLYGVGSGSAATGHFTQSGGTLHLGTGGKLNVENTLNVTGGTINITLGTQYEQNDANKGANAAITANSITYAGGAINLTGGDPTNKLYELIYDKTSTGTNTAIETAIAANTNYLFGYYTVNSGGLYAVGKSSGGGVTEKEFITAANTDTSSNTGIATALYHLKNNPAQSAKIAGIIAKLEAIKLDAHRFSRAVSELNNTNSNSAVGQLAIQKFNSTLGQIFSADATNSAALGGMPEYDEGGRRYTSPNDSQSAGGKPVTFSEVVGLTGANNSSGIASANWNGFMKVYGGFGAQGSNRAAVGYDFGGVGVMTGLDYKIADELKIGALFGYSYNSSTSYRSFGSASDNLLRMGLYSQFNWDKFFFNTAPTFGIHLLETQRRFETLALETAKGERTGFDFNWFNQAGYVFDIGGFLITPSYSLAMTYMRDPSYTETGLSGNAGGQQNLTVGVNNSWSLTQNLELKLGRVFCLNNNLAIMPEIWAGWEHEYLSANDVSMAFAVAPQNSWRSPVARIAADRATFGAGITTLISNRYEIFGRYDQKLWDGGFNTNFTIGASVKF